jgi:hypothetical protein
MHSNFGMDTYVPLHIDSGEGQVGFEVKGYDVHISLSDRQVPTMNSMDVSYVHFILNERDSYKRRYKKGEPLYSYGTLGHNFDRNNKVLVKKENIIENMSQGINIEHKYVGYTINLKKINSKMLVSLSFNKIWLNKKKRAIEKEYTIELSINEKINLQYISFASWSKPIYVKHLIST